MARIAPWILTTLSLFLGMFFFFLGMLKVSTSFNRELHREMRRNFVRYAKVFPLADHFGLRISHKHYRLAVGYTEILLGLSLAFLPNGIKQVANLVLIGLTLGAVYTHQAVDDPFDKMIPALSFCSILVCRFMLRLLLNTDAYQSNLKPEAVKSVKLQPMEHKEAKEQPRGSRKRVGSKAKKASMLSMNDIDSNAHHHHQQQPSQASSLPSTKSRRSRKRMTQQ